MFCGDSAVPRLLCNDNVSTMYKYVSNLKLVYKIPCKNNLFTKNNFKVEFILCVKNENWLDISEWHF